MRYLGWIVLVIIGMFLGRSLPFDSAFAQGGGKDAEKLEWWWASPQIMCIPGGLSEDGKSLKPRFFIVGTAKYTNRERYTMVAEETTNAIEMARLAKSPLLVGDAFPDAKVKSKKGVIFLCKPEDLKKQIEKSLLHSDHDFFKLE